MLDNLTKLICIVVIMVGMIAPAVVAYNVGLHNGRRQVARHIPRIRQLERINALAPRNPDE